ncbi:unnamed protein product [Hyaloperonospora brassicae]|uniref:Rho-GAP domain-containing protein n=1 Tax=Hyaloperonospora brassicae TaxID=162125 RepID=A0AAV0UK52_HYABA|nr:unnamed protein product [Hyaloperonospora brassicae]
MESFPAAHPTAKQPTDRTQQQQQQDEVSPYTPSHLLHPLPRSAMFGSCTQTASTVLAVFFHVVNQSRNASDTTAVPSPPTDDNEVTRTAKVLYVALLETVQKARGEWQGFLSSSTAEEQENPTAAGAVVPSARELLTTRLTQATASPTAQCTVLAKLLDVSLQSLRGPLVPAELYALQKTNALLQRERLVVPPAFATLLALRELFLSRLERDVRHCLLRLLALWDLLARAGSEPHALTKVVAANQHYVLSKSSDCSRMAPKSDRRDHVATDLLRLMVLYRDVLFSDMEYLPIKQELHVPSKLLLVPEDTWASDTESTKDDGQFSSDGDVSGSSSEDNSQRVCRRRRWYAQRPTAVSNPLVSGSMLLNDEDASQGGETDGSRRSLPLRSRCSSFRRRSAARKTMRSQSLSALPLPAGAAARPPVPVKLSSSIGSLPPLYSALRHVRPPRRVASDSTRKSPTFDGSSRVPSSDTVDMSRKLARRRSSLSSSSRTCRQKEENDGPESDPSESSTAGPSRCRGKKTKEQSVRSSTSSSSAARIASSSRSSTADRAVHDSVYQFSPHGLQDRRETPTYLSKAASYLTTPVAVATLCVLTSVATLAIFGMRKTVHD